MQRFLLLKVASHREEKEQIVSACLSVVVLWSPFSSAFEKKKKKRSGIGKAENFTSQHLNLDSLELYHHISQEQKPSSSLPTFHIEYPAVPPAEADVIQRNLGPVLRHVLSTQKMHTHQSMRVWSYSSNLHFRAIPIISHAGLLSPVGKHSIIPRLEFDGQAL